MKRLKITSSIIRNVSHTKKAYIWTYNKELFMDWKINTPLQKTW